LSDLHGRNSRPSYFLLFVFISYYLPWAQNIHVFIPMEVTERVGESSSSRRPRQKQPRKSLAESPASQLPRSSQKKRKARKGTSSEVEYSVKEIVDEKIEHGEIRYLIDWEDDPVTGESFKPTWVGS
jgi:hypothetical protein